MALTLHLGDIELPIIQASIRQAINENSSAVAFVRARDFWTHPGMALTSEVTITRQDELIFTGLVTDIIRERARIRVDLAGALAPLKDTRLTAAFIGFPAQELMYVILRSGGWPADRIEGLPIDSEPRWFDCIFALRSFGGRLPLSVDGDRVYRLAAPSDDHEKLILASPLASNFKQRPLARIRVIANEWAGAVERAGERATDLVASLDFMTAEPMAMTPGGSRIMPWRRSDLRRHPRVGEWHSIFDPKYQRAWIRRPDSETWRPLSLRKADLARLSTLRDVRRGIGRKSELREALRWLYIARESRSTTDSTLACWYALELTIGGVNLKPAFDSEAKLLIKDAVLAVPDLTTRQIAILRGWIDNLNAPTFRARLKEALRITEMNWSPSEERLVQEVRTFRNKVLHGATASLSADKARQFQDAVRKLATAMAEVQARFPIDTSRTQIDKAATVNEALRSISADDSDRES